MPESGPNQISPPPVGTVVVGVAVPLVGTGALIVFPDDKWVGWLLILAGLFVLLATGYLYLRWWWQGRPKPVTAEPEVATDVQSFKHGIRLVLSQGQTLGDIFGSRTKWDKAAAYILLVWQQPTFGQAFPERVQELVRQVIVASRQTAEPQRWADLQAAIEALLLFIEDHLRANRPAVRQSRGRSKRG